ncbi:MBL fold metallo-hydrolase [Sediminibacillus massiliensis]|uniref:MBL fold metallo-hydrolase n=1 Tax=Sediminibacillus massiliensis TaxID=1926277 RepID=UPI0009884BEC|nr:MBL fold metallo-hydrolase [Sediminibacillus massiliensis]
MHIEKLSLGPLGTNCYILYQQEKALIIDPGGDPEELVSWIEDKHLKPLAVLLTHAHFDHIGAVDVVRDRFNISVYVHEEEADWLPNPNLNGSSLFQSEPISARRADEFIGKGNKQIGGFEFEVRETPGHSPGGVSFVFHHDSFVISGDTLFQAGIGRTDLPGGDYDILLNSIKTELYTLADDYKVYPGHGGPTSIGIEKKSNPFIKQG